MATTLVGIFDDYKQAQTAVNALTKAGIKQGNISIARNYPEGKGYTTYGGSNSKDYTTGQSIGDSISNFFENLFGADESHKDDYELYSEAVRRGSTVVTVSAEENMVDEAAEILNKNGALDFDRRSAQYRAAGFKNYDAKAPLYNAEQSKTEFQQFSGQGEVALPVIEEQLNVGKRVVQRGGVRVHSRVTERPVEEQINLREEHVRVDRRPVNRAVTDADLANFKEGDITLTEHAEVVVAAKEAHVVEEVVIGKDVRERTETVRDTIRRTDVEVEEIDTDVDATKSRQAGK